MGGEDGKGKAAAGTPDFTSPKIQASRTDEDIITTITNGRSGTIMPAWKGKMTAEEITAVGSSVRSLGQRGLG
jgi:mono/diheme cytochrome c family protein